MRDNVIVDQMADGINIRRGWRDVRATNNFFRNLGDDAMAMWSNEQMDTGNTFDHNTIQTPVLANGIAIYGGRDNTVSDNLVADPVREGSALHAGYRHASTPFAGFLEFARNTTVRAGTRELNWDIGLGAIWFYALEGHMDADFRILDSDFLDVSYNAIQFVSEFAVRNDYGIEHVTVKDVRVDGTGTNVVNARAFGSASFENVDARNVGQKFINNCGSFNFPPDGAGVRRPARRRQRRRLVRLGHLVRRPAADGGAVPALALVAALDGPPRPRRRQKRLTLLSPPGLDDISVAVL